MKKRAVILIFACIIVIAGAISFYFNSLEKPSFEVTPSLFKVILDKGDTIIANMEIKNFGDAENFILKTGNLEGIIYPEKNNFIVEKGSLGKIKIDVSASDSVYGTHMGHISLSNGLEEKIIPFVVSIHTPTQFFAINLDVAPENKQLTKKEELETNIKFFNLYDDNSHTIDVDYKIININGEIILSDAEQITVGAKSSFTKKFAIPDDLALGDYVFVVSVNYLDTITTSNYLFSIIDRKPFSFLNVNSLAWIVIIFAGITFVLILYLIYERVTLFSRLKKQQHAQIKSFSKKIHEEKEKRLAKAKTDEQKKKIIEELQDAKIKVLAELKKQQKHQQTELKKLQTKKNIKERKKKLIQWRNESYPKALKSAQISSGLKNKLAVLKNAYSEGFIQKDSYLKGVSKIKSAEKKQKNKLYK